MRQHPFALLACVIAAASPQATVARGGIGREYPYAADHIEGLPADVRHAVLAHERACGGKAAATHYFAVSITSTSQPAARHNASMSMSMISFVFPAS